MTINNPATAVKWSKFPEVVSGTPIKPSDVFRIYEDTWPYVLGTNPPEWTIPLGWDERWSKI